MNKRMLVLATLLLSISACGTAEGPSAEGTGKRGASTSQQGETSSAAFWGGAAESMGAGFQVENFKALPAMADSADVVVLGRVVRSYPTRMVGEDEPEAPQSQVQLYGAEILIEEVVRGSLASDRRGSEKTLVVEAFTPYPDAATSDASLLFLRHKTSERSELRGLQPLDDRLYYRLVESQGVFVSRDGKADTPANSAREGHGLGPIVEQVRRENLSLEQLVDRLKA